jgi:DNA-binding response OmpR family regulator
MFDKALAEPEPVSQENSDAVRILAVDDDEGHLAALEHRLRQHGYRVLTASTAAQAKQLAWSHETDLVLLDLRLPDQDGFELCAELADHPRTCGIPIIVISGLDSPDIVRQTRSSGGSYYVRKPYDPNVVLALIEQALGEDTQPDW